MNFAKISLLVVLLAGCTTYRTPSSVSPIDYCLAYKPFIYSAKDAQDTPVNILAGVVYNNKQYSLNCKGKR